MKITLTPQQKQQLEQMHVSTRDSQVCDRIKATEEKQTKTAKRNRWRRK